MDLLQWLSRLQATLKLLGFMITEYKRYIGVLEDLEKELRTALYVHNRQSNVDTAVSRETEGTEVDGQQELPIAAPAEPAPQADLGTNEYNRAGNRGRRRS